MRNFILFCTMLCAMVLATSASPVQAQNILWVAASGNDGNTCSQTSPCLTFQGAINKGSVDQINCLNSGNYGPFTITASIIVDCGTGNIGEIVIGGIPNGAITINAASAITVILRHLSLNGSGIGAFGILSSSFPSGSLTVEDCTVQGFTGGSGIQFFPQTGRGLLQVSNTQTIGNGSGIFVFPGAGQIASVVLNGVETVGNVTGVRLDGPGIVAGTMRHSVAGANSQRGLDAKSGQVYFTVEESIITANLIAGIETETAGSVVNVGGSTIGGNGTGVKATAGQLISFGNNQMSANGTNGSFTSTTPLK